MLTMFIAPPAWIHLAWIYFPGYLVSYRYSRLRFSDHVYAQVSQSANRENTLGVPLLPADLHTSEPGAVQRHSEVGGRVTGPIRVSWDDWLYVPTSILSPERIVPARTANADLLFTSSTFLVTAGRWRPGTVLEVPLSRVVGVWNGADIPTVSSGDVVVIVVDIGNDELLFPFEVRSKGTAPTRRAAARQLVREVEWRRRMAT